MMLTPKAIVDELNKYIVGQEEAKRTLAIAFSNRERRKRLPPEIYQEITSQNILMVGPTGVGKTEIARRLASITDAPFMKVEATRFTEVGYVGRDAESIIPELMEVAAAKIYKERLGEIEKRAEKRAADKIVNYLYQQKAKPKASKPTRRELASLLKNHLLEGEIIEIEVEASEPLLESLDEDYGSLEWLEDLKGEGKKVKKRVPIKEARKMLTQEEVRSLVDVSEVIDQAIKRTEEGIVFIDETDKICGPQVDMGRDVSGEGVQRDLLSIIEGAKVMTRYGTVNTDHILFIAAGTFSRNKPENLIPEFQGRFPVRATLPPLSEENLAQILIDLPNSLLKQHQMLLSTEGVELTFAQDGIKEIAHIAFMMNERGENVGARRLPGVVEKVLEEASFSGTKEKRIVVDRDYVLSHLENLTPEGTLDHYIV
jgi:ATP-dependent HslUV protease ATP-binding subunit HslU